MKRNVSFLSARESVILGFGALLFFGQDITLSALRYVADRKRALISNLGATT